jgi:hypothetical protein
MRAEVGWGLNPRVEFAKPLNDGGLDPPPEVGDGGLGTYRKRRPEFLRAGKAPDTYASDGAQGSE